MLMLNSLNPEENKKFWTWIFEIRIFEAEIPINVLIFLRMNKSQNFKPKGKGT